MAITDAEDGEVHTGAIWQSVIDTVDGVIDAIENTSTGHDHDGTDSKSILSASMNLDWDNCWTDAVHSHASDAEGGTLDWDNVWADAVHDHSSDAEGGKSLSKAIIWRIVYANVINGVALSASSATKVSKMDTNSIDQTTDYQTNTISWTIKNSNVGDVDGGFIITCAADRTKAFALERSGAGDGAFTSTSGDTWSDASTNLPNNNFVSDVSFPTAAVAVACGTKNAGTESIWLSINGGDDWAQISDDGAAEAVIGCISMFNATNGFAGIVSSDTILISDANGGGADEWEDSGRNAVRSFNGFDTMFAVSATVYLIAHINYGICRGTTSADPTIVCPFRDTEKPTHFIKTTNGNIYIATYPNEAQEKNSPITLYKSEDDGVTWSKTVVGYGDMSDTAYLKTIISEAGDNVIILLQNPGDGGGQIIEVDES